MTASLPGVFNVQQFTDSGAPASGFRLYTYTPGTTTHKVAYVDAAAATPHTYTSDGAGGLYIGLNARGELPAPLFLASGGYDLCLKTAAGATVWTRRANGLDDGLASVYAALADAGSASGDALVSVGAVSCVIGGTRTRYASINAAVLALGSAVCSLQVQGATTLTGSVTVPATMALDIAPGAVVTLGGYTLTVNGGFSDPGLVQCFSGSGSVVFAIGSSDYVRPEWWGAKADANAAGTSGTDSTAAIQAAANTAPPILLTAGNYLFSNLTSPANKRWTGAGIHATNMIAKSGSTGTMFTDQGGASGAAKIDMDGIAWYGNNCAYTAGLRLGYNGVQFGTEACLDVWVRDLPAGFPGIDISGNVAHASRLLSQDTGGLRIVGAANMIDKAQAYGSKGFIEAGISVGCSLQLTSIGSLEVEATATGVVPIYFLGNCTIGDIFIAPTAGATYPHLMELGASCTSWNFTLNLLFAGGAAPTVTNGNIKSGTRYFGGNATGKNAGGEGFYTSDTYGQRSHSFFLRIVNTGGTLQHRISTGAGGTTSSAPSISGATASLTNTPTGADASTAMAAGGKIGSATTSAFYFDARDQADALIQMLAGPVVTTCGTALVALPFVQTLTINGVSRTLLGVQFLNAATGVAYALSSLTAGQYVQVQLHGFMGV